MSTCKALIWLSEIYMRRSQSPAEIHDVFSMERGPRLEMKKEKKEIIICVGVHMMTANNVSPQNIFLFRVFSTTDDGASSVFVCTECASFLLLFFFFFASWISSNVSIVNGFSGH